MLAHRLRTPHAKLGKVLASVSHDASRGKAGRAHLSRCATLHAIDASFILYQTATTADNSRGAAQAPLRTPSRVPERA
jgi:hypothetical protein